MSARRGLAQMHAEAVDLSRLTLSVRASLAHPGGRCARTAMPCPSCRQPAPLEPVLGTMTIRCRPCSHGWGVEHHPERCWQPLWM
ncbi:hypothetical protein [Streptomyces sp. NPDC086023]|uniref:hypothetical protein n=1 Tax=Streptomyces sp. NPDC086023 TaxID=3365746 RepID=UPI0037D83D96